MIVILVIKMKSINGSIKSEGCFYLSDNKVICNTKDNKTYLPEIVEEMLETNVRRLAVHYRIIPILPDYILSGSERFLQLDLSHNSIETISNDSFSNLVSIRTLELSDNKIQTIDYIFEKSDNCTKCKLFQKLKTLNLIHNQLTQLKNKVFECLVNLEQLVLDYNDLYLIEKNAFSNLKYLIRLSIRSNRLKHVKGLFDSNILLLSLSLSSNNLILNETSPFETLSELKSLSLSFNDLEIVKKNFKGLRNLEQLYLESTNISNLKKDIFKEIRLVRLIDLTDNNLTTIEGVLSKRNFLISQVVLLNNRISFINSLSFKDAGFMLSEIYMSNNKITDIEDDSFRFTPYLTYLGLQFNKMKILRNNMFKGLRYLVELNMEYNEIELIEAHSLKSLEEIYTIVMSHNKIDSINFTIPKNVRTVDFCYNQIEYMAPGTFQGLLRLIFVYLNNNNLKILQTNSFLGCQLITVLTLTNNSIHEIEINSLPMSFGAGGRTHDLQFNKIKRLKPYTFRNLKVDSLVLSHNEIEVIDENAFNEIAKIKEICLKYNKIYYIAKGAFNGILNLKLLDLSHNVLRSFDYNFFESFNRINLLLLNHNQLESIGNNTLSTAIDAMNLESNPITFIHPNFTNDLEKLQVIRFDNFTLLEIDFSILIKAFKPRKISLVRFYNFYNPIKLFVTGEDIYTKEFCVLTFDLIKNNILLNMGELSQINKIINQCHGYIFS